MGFSFYPKHEHNCPNVSHCPHLGGAALGTLVLMATANSAATTPPQHHRRNNSAATTPPQQLRRNNSAATSPPQHHRRNITDGKEKTRCPGGPSEMVSEIGPVTSRLCWDRRFTSALIITVRPVITVTFPRTQTSALPIIRRLVRASKKGVRSLCCVTLAVLLNFRDGTHETHLSGR